MSICLTVLTTDTNIAENAEILAVIFISAWRSGFQGILPESIIEKYTQFISCKAMFSQLLDSGIGTMYLATLDEKPAGLLYWLTENENPRIEALLTISEAWGRGVGAALIERALADIGAAGYSAASVWSFAENHRARHFYEKHGFHPTGQTRIGDASEMEYIHFL